MIRILLLCGFISCISALTRSDFHGTLLLMQTNNIRGEGRGWLFLQDMQTGLTDTLVRSIVTNPCFSPDGRKVAYKDSATNRIHTIDIYTRQITDYTPAAGWFGSSLSWCKDGIYFTNGGRYVYRLNLSTGQAEFVYRPRFNGITIPDTTKVDMTQGGVSYDGTRATFTVLFDVQGNSNHVMTMDFTTGEEVMMNYGTQLSCQSDISPDGLFCAHTDYTHRTGYLNNFNVWMPEYQLWGGDNFWFFRFPVNTSKYVFYRLASDSLTYLRVIDLLTSVPVTKYPLSVYDAYFGGWLLDTITPNPPVNLASPVQTEKSIQLTWNAPASGPAPTEYIVKRDGIELATIAGTTYTDENLSESTRYQYSVQSRTIGINFSTAVTGTFSTTADNIPPSPVMAFSLSATTVDVLFSEPVDSASAALKTNYSMDNAVSISSAARPTSKRARLTTGTFSSITDSLIRVTGVKDKSASANTATGGSCPLTLIRDLWTSSGKGAWAYLDSGTFVWCDDDYPQAYFTQRSPLYNGLPIFLTSVSDGSTDSTKEFIRFTISRPLEVIIRSQYDSTHVQGWLKDPLWRKSVDPIGNIYSKVFPAGTVSLKGNGFTKYSTYNVILRNAGPSGSTGLTKPENAGVQPPVLALSPIPFSSRVTISYFAPSNSSLALSIFDTQGRLVRRLTETTPYSGQYKTSWDGKDDIGKQLPNGIYFCKLTLNKQKVLTKQLVLVQ